MKKISLNAFASIVGVMGATLIFANLASAKVTKLAIESGNAKDKQANVFNKEKLTVKAGDEVELKFTSNVKDVNMMHNWVLVKPGKADAVALAGTTAGADKGWFTQTDDVIAHTEALTGGPKPKSTTVKFKVPAKGTYPYLCTYPGHSLTMKGVLVVQ